MSKTPFNHLAAAKARDKRAVEPQGKSVPSTPNTPQKTPSISTALSPAKPKTLSPQNVSPQEIISKSPQKPQPKHINDPSYRQLNPQAKSDRIVDQMNVAKTDPRMIERQTPSDQKVARQDARNKFAERARNGFNPLVGRQETGVAGAFAAGSQIQHRITKDAQGRNAGQEAARPARMGLNTRPSQRVHKK